MSATRSPGTSAFSKAARAAQRKALARQAARRRRIRQVGLAAVPLVLVAAVAYLVTRGGDTSPTATPRVGGDLHTVTVIDNAIYVGGHEAVAVSRDGGKQWQPIGSLGGADAMGWAVIGDTVLVGGHPGLYRSTDGGQTFGKVTGSAAIADVHALGAAGSTVYLASPRRGLLASSDGGTTWQVRNAQTGTSFMGTILVDPKDPARLIAPDMQSGLVTSSDGGLTWKALGGPGGAMAAAWNPADTRQIIAVGMQGAARSGDGGATWQTITVPAAVSAVAFDTTGATLYAGALDGMNARLYRSADGGTTWTATA